MILHITNDYSGSTVYKNLVKNLDDLHVAQIVYTPVREAVRLDKNKIDLKNAHSEIIYAHILNKTDRIFYRKKINKIVKDIEAQVDLTKITFIHAHTWYSDGGAAYILSKKYNIPYIVAVRSTDINFFYKLLIHERAFGKKILHRSEKIILINKIFKNVINNIDSSLERKLQIVPNGVNRFWIENSIEKKSNLENSLSILYVGTFIKRKNLLNVLKAVIAINRDEKYGIVKCNVVGYGDGNYADAVKKIVEENTEIIYNYGKITDEKKLLEIYRQNAFFAMPSKNETFGLVYIEALLQGLPVLYTENDGIDGFYQEKIGEKVRSGDVEDIKNKLILLLENYNNYNIPTDKLKHNHDWKRIAEVYRQLYMQ